MFYKNIYILNTRGKKKSFINTWTKDLEAFIINGAIFTFGNVAIEAFEPTTQPEHITQTTQMVGTTDQSENIQPLK